MQAQLCTATGPRFASWMCSSKLPVSTVIGDAPSQSRGDGRQRKGKGHQTAMQGDQHAGRGSSRGCGRTGKHAAQSFHKGSSSLKTCLLDLQLGTVRESDVVKGGHGGG